jgi:cyclophilin family peptidyl-prolyl cis-trans isomerase
MIRKLRLPNSLFLTIALLLAVLIVGSCSSEETLEPGLYARIETNRGEILISLEPERAPMTVMNFVGLAEGTIDTQPPGSGAYYDGLTFHRVEPGFVIQGGDPVGNGSGGPGYEFPTETHPELLHDSPGVVAMANSGPDTNGSQFYITMSATPHLDGGYNVFGRVEEGMEIVEKIVVGDQMLRIEIIRSGSQYQKYTANTETFRALVDVALAERQREFAEIREQALERIKTAYPNAKPLADSGIYIEQLATGSGDPPRIGTSVSVHLSMALLDGAVLNDSRSTGQPLTFVYQQQRLLPGLEIAIGTLRVGDRVNAIVPPELSFGAAGAPPTIPPGSYIVFGIERLETPPTSE